MDAAVRIERVKGGYAAYSAEWGVAAAGQTEREALTQLEGVLLLFHRLAERADANKRTKLERRSESPDDRLRSDSTGL